jgi:hypothetical protein
MLKSASFHSSLQGYTEDPNVDGKDGLKFDLVGFILFIVRERVTHLLAPQSISYITVNTLKIQKAPLKIAHA